MAFLIVDPDPHSRKDAAAMVTWVDRRHRVDFADNGAAAMEVASERRPRIVFINPELPDMPGQALCAELRARYPRLVCVALTNDDKNWEGFDHYLRKPPTRLEVLSVIQESKLQAKQTKETRQEPLERRWLSVPFSNGNGNGNGMSSRIFVSLFDESMQFGVNVPENATVGVVIEQLGKRAVHSFRLLRNGKEFDSTAETHIQNGDFLILKL